MKIKPTMTYHFMPVRMIIIKKANVRIFDEDVQKLKPFCTFGRNENGAATIEKYIEVHHGIKDRATL
jgi:protein tyrosine phosphatase (PTP) superfamily phosphohydrolase (DUF442 family)